MKRGGTWQTAGFSRNWKNLCLRYFRHIPLYYSAHAPVHWRTIESLVSNGKLFCIVRAITHRWHSICQRRLRSHLLPSGCRCCSAPWAGIAYSAAQSRHGLWSQLAELTFIRSLPFNISFILSRFLSPPLSWLLLSLLAPFRGAACVMGNETSTSQSADQLLDYSPLLLNVHISIYG